MCGVKLLLVERLGHVMKKILSLMLVVSVLCCAYPVGMAVAETVYSGYCGAEGNEENIRWSFDSSTGTLTFSGSGAMRDWRHQTDFDSYDTTLEGYVYTPWYSYREKILHGVIADGITVMGNFTFSGCSNLQDVSLSENLTNIGVGGFESCSSLISVEVPETVTFLGVGAFYNDTSLSSVTLPEGLEIIYYGAFCGCEALAQLEIPSTVYQINAAAFAYCSSLKTLEIPAGVGGVSSYTFYYCTGLTSIKFLGDIRYINKCAFYKCTKLSSFTIMESCTFIGEDAFTSCSRLTLRCYADTYGEVYCREQIASNRYQVVSHDFQIFQVVEPTCTEQGYTILYCAECDRYRTDAFQEALGHVPGEWYISVVATPEADGERTSICTVCGELIHLSYPYQLPGDVDLDQVLTVYDAVRMLQYSAGLVEFDEYAFSAGDLNHNCQIDADDSVLLLQRLSGILDSFPAY